VPSPAPFFCWGQVSAAHRQPCSTSHRGERDRLLPPLTGDAISPVALLRWDVDEPDGFRPGQLRSRFGGFVERVDEFDASCFGVGRPEAEMMDPQHRLLLEVWSRFD
jgi:Beta-ketoacyl synthase, N-terminal domain